MRPPLRSPAVVRPLLFVHHRARDNLVGCCVQLSIGGRLKQQRILIYSFFAPKLDGQKGVTAFSPIVSALRAASHKYTPTMRPTFGWLLCLAMQQEPSQSEAPLPSLFYFSSSLILLPETMKRPSPCIPPLRIASPMLPPPPTPSFGWLLLRTIEQRPFKASAPPVSQYSDGRRFGNPKKGTKRSAREPGCRTPPLGS